MSITRAVDGSIETLGTGMGKFTSLVQDHLILPAQVGPTIGQEQRFCLLGQGVPRPLSISLLIDTGSRRTTLIPGIIQHMQPTAESDVQVETPLARVATTLYWVRLEFPKTKLAPFPEVLAARLAMPPGLSHFHGLLGRDLLRRWESCDYQGLRGSYTVRDTPGLFGWLRRWL
jgi:hypothetical protein